MALIDGIYSIMNNERWNLKRLIIVSPYISTNFFKELAADFEPEKILLIVDDSCDSQKAHKALENLQSESRLYFASGKGLVHPKLYYFHYRSSQSNKYRKFLAWGSANATYEGFHKNTEVLSVARLRPSTTPELIEYFEKLWEQAFSEESDNVENVERDALETKVSKNTNIFLPRLNASRNNVQDSFEAWVQAGFLCHKYNPQSSFLKFQLTLANPLPADTLGKQLEGIGLTTVETRQNLVYPFIHVQNGNKEDKWRAKYFIDTYLGFWCSKGCLNHFGHTFLTSNSEGRRRAVDTLLAENENGDTDQYLRAYKNLLSRSRRIFADNEELYLPEKNDYYLERADGQLQRQIVMAQNSFFRNTYVSGVELQPLPKFRSDESSWQSFMQHFCESLLFYANHKLPLSRLGETVKEIFGDDIAVMSPEKLLENLREDWHSYKKRFAGYHLFGSNPIPEMMRAAIEARRIDLPEEFGPWVIDNNSKQVWVCPSRQYYHYDEDNNTETGLYFGIEDIGNETMKLYFFAADCDEIQKEIIEELVEDDQLEERLQGTVAPEDGYLFTREISVNLEELAETQIIQTWCNDLLTVISELSPYMVPIGE